VNELARRLAAQRLLQAALALVVLLSALLLWTLRAPAPRGRGGERAAEAHAADALVAPAPVVEPAVDAPETRARAELAASEPEDARDDGTDEEFDPAAVRGRVVSDGTAVAGAELWIFGTDVERRERRSALAETKSDARGRFRFRALEPYVRYALVAQHPDFLPEEDTVFPGHVEEVELQPGVAVSGRVLSSAGLPLAGVEVALERWNFAPDGMHERVSSTSDGDGRWRLPWAESGMQSFLALRPGRLPERREFQVGPEGGDGYEIRLDDARVLELELYALEDGALLADTQLLSDGVPVQSDAHGRLALPLAPGAASNDWVRLNLALAGGCTTQLRANPAAGALVRAPLARGGTVRGRVLDADGAPVADARVRLAGGGRTPASLRLPDGVTLSPPRDAGRTLADGSFALTGLPPRETPVELRATHPEHPPGRSKPFEFTRLGQEEELEVRLQVGGTIAGTLRVDGQPAALRLYWDGADSSGWTRSNDRGAYRIAGVPAGQVALRPRLEHEDEDVERAEDQDVWVEERATVTADFDLAARRALIRGRVLDAEGAPVSDAVVRAEASDEESRDESIPEAECDREGRFELSVPDAPTLTFELTAASGARRASKSEVRAGAEVELVLPALAEVGLRVVDALRHEPVLGFRLYWRDSVGGEYRRLSQGGSRLSPGADGTFVAELPAGTLDLVVSARAQGFLPAHAQAVRLQAGRGATLEFALEPGAELELTVAPGEGVDVSRLLQRGRISAISADQWAENERGGEFFQQEIRNPQTLRVDGSGAARLAAMPSGTYRFHGLPKGYVVLPAEFELPPVARQAVRVTLAREKEKPGAAGD